MMEHFEAYETLRDALEQNNPDPIQDAVEALPGGQDVLLELINDHDAPTWRAVLLSLDEQKRREALRTPENETLNDVLAMGLDEGWLPGKLSILTLRNAIRSTATENETVLRLINQTKHWENAITFDLYTFYQERGGDILTRDQFKALVNHQGLDRSVYEEVLKNGSLHYLQYLLEDEDYDRTDHFDESLLDIALGAERPNQELFKILYDHLSLSDKEWLERLTTELDEGNSSAAAMIGVADLDQSTINDVLEQAVEKQCSTNRDRARFLRHLAERASTYPEAAEYGQWLLLMAGSDEDYVEHFIAWLKDGGDVTQDVLEQAFTRRLPGAVRALYDEQHLDRANARKALRSMLSEEERTAELSEEVGVLHALPGDWLETRDDESLMVTLLERQADDAVSDLAIVGQTLMGYEAQPRRDERERVYELIERALSDIDSAEEWLSDLVEHLLERNLRPGKAVLRSLREHSNAMEALFKRKLSRRQRHGAGFQSED